MLSEWLREGRFPIISVRLYFNGDQVALLERTPPKKGHSEVSPCFVYM